MCDVCRQTPCDPRCPYAPEPPIIHRCCSCENDIFEGDDYYDLDGEPWCEDCVASSRKTAESEK